MSKLNCIGVTMEPNILFFDSGILTLQYFWFMIFVNCIVVAFLLAVSCYLT